MVCLLPFVELLEKTYTAIPIQVYSSYLYHERL